MSRHQQQPVLPDMLEVSDRGSDSRGIPVLPPLADRQRHRLVHLLFRNGCTFLPDRSWTRGKPPEAREKRDHGTAILAGLHVSRAC